MDDRDKRRKRDFFDIIDELIKDLNKMMKDLMEDNLSNEDLNKPNIRGFSIYLGPDGIDIRDLSGNSINMNDRINLPQKGMEREYLNLDYDIVDEEGFRVLYVDLRRVSTDNLKIEKDGFFIKIKSGNKVYTLTLPKDMTKYDIKEYKVKNGVLRIVLSKKKGFFRF